MTTKFEAAAYREIHRAAMARKYGEKFQYEVEHVNEYAWTFTFHLGMVDKSDVWNVEIDHSYRQEYDAWHGSVRIWETESFQFQARDLGILFKRMEKYGLLHELVSIWVQEMEFGIR